MLLEYIVGGAVVGAVVGATGVGGGSLMTPLLTLVFGLPVQVAVGTDLLFASITKFSGALTHWRRGNVHWALTGWLALGSVPSALVTIAALRAWHPEAGQLAAFVRPALAAALLLTAASLLLRPWIQGLGKRFAQAKHDAAHELGTQVRPLPTVALGVVIGAMVTLTSVGAGVIGVVALLFLYPALSAKRLVAVDIAHAIPLTLVAGLGHVALGSVNWTVLGALLLGSVPAIALGALLADRMPEKVLRVLLATMLTLIGARLVVI
ncbi:MAG: sulfite exporter TauE/SafE family protein [Burkholderiaceae bacterium]|nr:sulfite exporter TauE/SafE family protein [Burkholderiaceae bacterium]